MLCDTQPEICNFFVEYPSRVPGLLTHIAATVNALRLCEIARVLVRFDHVASFTVNTMVSTRLRSRKRKNRARASRSRSL